MIKVRIENNIVKEIIPAEATDPSIEYWYGEEFAAQCVDAPDDVVQGMVYDATAETFSESKESADQTTISLEDSKASKIAESKTSLATYLENNPLAYTDSKQYSVTSEKQTLLNNNLAVYKIAVELGQAVTLTWNATGEECAEWTYENLCALALTIAAYVKPLVAKQQEIEIAINACTTIEEVEAIVIDYSTVSSEETTDETTTDDTTTS